MATVTTTHYVHDSEGWSNRGFYFRITKGVHYFDREEDIPAGTDEGRLYFVKVE